MIELSWSDVPSALSPMPGVTVEGGLLLVLRSRADLDRLKKLCIFIRSNSQTSEVIWHPRVEDRDGHQMRQLAAALIAGRFPDHADASEDIKPAQLRSASTLDALLLALMAVAELWPSPDTGRLALCIAISMPGAYPTSDVTIKLDQPRAALWMTPGSVIAGLSVGAVLKAARWVAAVFGVFSSASAGAAATSLVQALWDKGSAACKHLLPRLDALAETERSSLRAKPVLLVFLHGLLATDRGTFDGFISRLLAAHPGTLETSMGRLAASAPLALVRRHAGVGALHQALASLLSNAGRRLDELDDTDVRQFIERHVGLVGWPHDSLAPVDSCATDLAALLKKEFGSPGPRHIVFVCHSQGGLLARAAALELAKMNAPTARWRDRIAAIATFGTPHRGAAIAEPGGKNGREAAAFLMMLSGTGKPSSLADLLALIGERRLEGIEDLKTFNATTLERENSIVQRLLKEELAQSWPGEMNRPAMLLVGGKLGEQQKTRWRDRVAAAFVEHKLRHNDHDLVVETTSSLAPAVEPQLALEVASDHFSYFDGEGEAALALEAIVAHVWTLLGPETTAWAAELSARDQAKAATRKRVPSIKFEVKPPAEKP